MAKYVCTVCGYIYDEAVGEPDNGIAAGTKWEDLPDDYVCPLCGVGKDMFEKEYSTAEPVIRRKSPCGRKSSVWAFLLKIKFPAGKTGTGG